MATAELKGKDLLEVVKQLPAKEFDTFLNGLTVRSQPKSPTLSKKETKLIKEINRGLPMDLCRRQTRLAGRLRQGTLTATEHKELLRLTHLAESRDAKRAAALVELANLRRLPVRVLMKQMGIQAPPVHG